MVIKVLVATPVYYPEVGGGALATYLITDLLARSGQLKLTVLTGVKNPKMVSGVNYIYDPLMKLINKQYFSPLMLAKRYQKILKEHDIIYVVYAFPFIPLGKAYGKKVIVHLHDYRPISLNGVVLAGTGGSSDFRLLMDSFNVKLIQKSGIVDLIKNVMNIPYTLQVRRWVCMGDTVIAVSRRHAEILSKYMPECKGKIRVLYNPPPKLPKFEKKLENVPTFLYCGGDSYIKGFHILIKALKIIGEKKHTRIKFVLTGRYSQKSLNIINRLKKRYNLDIKVLGIVEYNDLAKLHSKAWALLFPSIWEEPLPYAIIESLVNGTIPIASKVGGVTEIIESTRAKDFLFNPWGFDELVQKIEIIMNYAEDNLEKKLSLELAREFQNIYNKFCNQRLYDRIFLDP
ncbi:MAG: glycosyltransferase family 4 protein [Candidatus Bathyarchaeia archaeon]